MKEQTVRMLNEELADTDTQTLVSNVDRGIGLRNVNARIKNFYGKEYGIQIERKALIRKIHMAEPEAEIIADFENGLQAAAYIRENRSRIDLLFTDVKMPEMDGLELAKCIAEEEMRAQMSVRTVEYLSIAELVSHDEWRGKFLSPIFQKYGGEDSTSPIGFYLAVVQAENGEQKNEVVDREIERFIKDRNRCRLYFRRYKEHVLLMFQDEEDPAEELSGLLRRILAKGGEKMTAGVSQHHTGVPELKKAYQEAVYAINQRLIDGWVKVYSYKGEMRPSNHFTKEAEVLLGDAIEKQKCAAAEEVVSRTLEKCRDAYSLYITISGIFNLMYRIFCRSARSEEKDSEHVYMLFSYRSDLYGFRHFYEVEDYVKKIVESMCQEQEEKTHHYIVAEMLDYIEKNYQTNISLSELAEHKYFMNSSYLSRLFKNEVGQTFSKYLMEFRIRKAAGLLENELLKINDVAMLAGYNDVSHFIQYFKKIYGCTPEEYRHKRLEEMKYV